MSGLRRCRRAVAELELRPYDHALRRALWRSDLVEKEHQALPPDLVEVLAHRGQRRREEARLGDVVEADDAHLARHVAAGLVQRAQYPERHLVVGGEDRGHVANRRKSAAELVAGLR